MPGRLSPREVPCPTCGARAVEPCRGVKRPGHVTYHHGRRRAAVLASPGVQLGLGLDQKGPPPDVEK
jgi:hypothetical protein